MSLGVFSVLVVFILIFLPVLSWPGQGVISIYYETEWLTNSTFESNSVVLTYSADFSSAKVRNISLANVEMWGPRPEFHSKVWQYYEIGARSVALLEFRGCLWQNSSCRSSGTKTPQDANSGHGWLIPTPGEYAINMNGTSSSRLVRLTEFPIGCAGSPREHVDAACCHRGKCFLDGLHCQCDDPYVGVACEGSAQCTPYLHMVSIGSKPYRVVPYSEGLFSEAQCCALCFNESKCSGALFDWNTYSCSLFTNANFSTLRPALAENVTDEVVFFLRSPTTPTSASTTANPTTTVAPTTQHPPPETSAHPKTANPTTGHPTTVSPTSGNPNDNDSHTEEYVIIAGASVGTVALVGGLLLVNRLTSKTAASSPKNKDPETTSGKGQSGENTYDGKYRVLKTLGRGAFGVVYLVTKRVNSIKQPAPRSPRSHADCHSMKSMREGTPGTQEREALLGRSSPVHPNEEFYAMKVIHCQTDEEMMTAFREFKSMNALQGHEGIVRVLDMFMSWELNLPGASPTILRSTSAEMVSSESINAHEEDPNADPPARYLCIVMEFCEGGNLEQGISKDPRYFRGTSIVISFATQICAAMAFSHSKGIIHRDMKPANVLLNHNWERVVLTDFGLARDIEGTQTTQAAGGTLHYLSPEQIEHRVSRKSDVWAVGCILVAMVTGKVGMHVRAMFMFRQQPDSEAELRAELKNLPEWFVNLILRMLDLRPHDRPTCEECLEIISRNPSGF